MMFSRPAADCLCCPWPQPLSRHDLGSAQCRRPADRFRAVWPATLPCRRAPAKRHVRTRNAYNLQSTNDTPNGSDCMPAPSLLELRDRRRHTEHRLTGQPHEPPIKHASSVPPPFNRHPCRGSANETTCRDYKITVHRAVGEHKERHAHAARDCHRRR